MSSSKKKPSKLPLRKSIAKPTKVRSSVDSPIRTKIRSYSGKFSVRVPKSLHQALVLGAEQQGMSFNGFVTTSLSVALGLNSLRRNKRL